MTDEPLELVEPWIAEVGATHPVVIMPEGQLEKVIGVEYFPTGAVFLDRKLTFKGSAGDTAGPLESARKTARKDSVYPKKLGKIIKAMNKGDQVKALADLRKLKPKLEGRDLAWATNLEGFMLGASAKAFDMSASVIEAGFWYEGVAMVEPYLQKGSLFPRIDETRAQLEYLKAKPLYKKEMKGGEIYAEGQDLEVQKLYLEAFNAYKSVLKKAAGTQIAEHARVAAQKLMEDRRPGYKASCQTCYRNKGSACAKHLEKVKL
ncbi:MAG: hypothetical protein ACYTEP_05225 [Planctomycetota bacterium]